MCVCVCRSIENIYTQADKYKLCTCVYTLEGNSCIVSATVLVFGREERRKCQQKSLGERREFSKDETNRRRNALQCSSRQTLDEMSVCVTKRAAATYAEIFSSKSPPISRFISLNHQLGYTEPLLSLTHYAGNGKITFSFYGSSPITLAAAHYYNIAFVRLHSSLSSQKNNLGAMVFRRSLTYRLLFLVGR
jgi:hypothetical protein